MSTVPKFKLKDSKPDSDFVQWNESMSHKQDIDLYYEGSHPLIRWVEKLRLKIIIDLIKEHSEKNNLSNPVIVEAGCGTGHVLQSIAENIKTDNLIGIDPLEWWLDKARKRLGDKAKLIKGFAEDIPFEDKSVHFAICTEVIEHVIDPTVVLKELKRIIKDDGLIVVSIPNEKLINRLKDVIDFFKIYQKLFSNIPKHNDDEWHIHSFDLNLFKKYIPDGLKIQSVIPLPSFILPLRYVITLV
ncbi:MAG: class I SAM-dependent methyltransferase [Candidatus Melainabacteria bacterium]|nr:class I SAM-dependent methyltransferase [Candidatus Melainabacteria bacterium]